MRRRDTRLTWTEHTKQAFKAQIDAGSGGSSRKKAVVPCPSCNRTPRVPKQGGGGGEDVSVVGSKRKREESAGGGGKPAAWEKALEAAEPPSPLVLECKGGCNLLYCQLCRTSLAPAGAHRAWGARHEQEGDRAGCACLPLQRLVALEAATAAMLEEMQRERKGTGRAAAKKPQAAARPAASAAAAAQKGKWAAGTGFGGSSSGSSSGYGDLDGAFDGDWESHGSYEDHSDEDDDAGHDDRYTKFWQKKKKEAQPSKAEVAAKERQEKEDAAIRSLLGRWRQALPKGPMQAPILPETQVNGMGGASWNDVFCVLVPDLIDHRTTHNQSTCWRAPSARTTARCRRRCSSCCACCCSTTR